MVCKLVGQFGECAAGSHRFDELALNQIKYCNKFFQHSIFKGISIQKYLYVKYISTRSSIATIVQPDQVLHSFCQPDQVLEQFFNQNKYWNDFLNQITFQLDQVSKFKAYPATASSELLLASSSGPKESYIPELGGL